MTVYAGDILAVLDQLQAGMDAVDSFETAPVSVLAPLIAGAQALTGALDVAVATLDAQIDPSASGGLAGATSGAFPIKTAAALRQQVANGDQMTALVDLRGHAGRLLVNLQKAGR